MLIYEDLRYIWVGFRHRRSVSDLQIAVLFCRCSSTRTLTTFQDITQKQFKVTLNKIPIHIFIIIHKLFFNSIKLIHSYSKQILFYQSYIHIAVKPRDSKRHKELIISVLVCKKFGFPYPGHKKIQHFRWTGKQTDALSFINSAVSVQAAPSPRPLPIHYAWQAQVMCLHTDL